MPLTDTLTAATDRTEAQAHSPITSSSVATAHQRHRSDSPASPTNLSSIAAVEPPPPNLVDEPHHATGYAQDIHRTPSASRQASPPHSSLNRVGPPYAHAKELEVDLTVKPSGPEHPARDAIVAQSSLPADDPPRRQTASDSSVPVEPTVQVGSSTGVSHASSHHDRSDDVHAHPAASKTATAGPRNVARGKPLWQLQYSPKHPGNDPHFMALYDLMSMVQSANLGHLELDPATAADLRRDSTARDAWFASHEEDFRTLTGSSVTTTYERLTKQYKAGKSLVPVWFRGSTHYKAVDSLRKDWNRVNDMWYTPQDTVDGIPRQYAFGPAYNSYSCAYDCVLWIALQLDAWRRRADEYSGLSAYHLTIQDRGHSTIWMTALRHGWDESTYETKLAVRSVLREAISSNTTEPADASHVLDMAFKDLAQINFISIAGFIPDEGTAVGLKRRSCVRAVIPATLSNNTDAHANSFSSIITTAMTTWDHSRFEDVMLAGEVPYVLQVRPTREQTDVLIPQPISWGDLLEKVGGLTAIDTIKINPPALIDNVVKRRMRPYNLVGILILSRQDEPEQVGHYTVVWRRGDRMMVFDDMSPLGRASITKGIGWDIRKAQVVVALFYEIVVDDAEL